LSAQLFAGVAILLYGGFIFYLTRGFFRLAQKQNACQPNVTVIIAAHNEALNLPRCLQAVMAQDYPQDKLEILAINDRSVDATGLLIETYATKFSNLKTLHIKKSGPGCSHKKHALAEGVRQASGEIILTTDADCLPPASWVSTMVKAYDARIGVATGYAPFSNAATLFGKILQIENLATALVAAGGVGWNKGITCAGRNFSYRKKTFEQVGGFSSMMRSVSGDDDLLLQLITRKTNWQAAFVRDCRAAVPSPAAADFKSYRQQRRRHVSAGRFYPRSLQLGYFLFNLCNITLCFAPVYATIQKESLFLPCLALGLKLILDLIGLMGPINDLQQWRLLYFFLPWELFHLADKVFISPLGFIGKISDIKWK